jgi:hypothetical protein
MNQLQCVLITHILWYIFVRPGSTVAIYNTSYDAATLLTTANSTDIIYDYVATNATSSLSQSYLTVNGTNGTANATYLNTVMLQEASAAS